MPETPRVFVTESTVYIHWGGMLPRTWTQVVHYPHNPYTGERIARSWGPPDDAIELGPIAVDHDDGDDQRGIADGRQ